MTFLQSKLQTGDDSLVLSIDEARKILGKSAKTMSDDEIREVILNLHSIARMTLQTISENKKASPSNL